MPIGEAAARADALWKRRLANVPPGGTLARGEAGSFAAFALNRVSRTFALNIRVLPRPLRQQVLYAYLYCRMADTIEDDPALPAPEKFALLGAFAALFDPDRPADASRAAFAAFPSLLPASWQSEQSAEDWEKILLARAPVLLEAFPDFPAPARVAIARCVREMCLGMADFALRSEQRATGRTAALIENVAELDRYCYYVAGTVGVMLCELFIDHADIRGERAEAMRALCVSFGLGLQLTNILKDLRDDAERGVSWLPADLLAAEGLAPESFFLAENREAARRVYARLFAKARRHLEEALEYTCRIPRSQRRLRLFCLWPLFMAAETLALLAENTDALSAGARLKISRARVARILFRTRFLYPFNTWLRAEFRGHMSRLKRALPLPSPSDTFTP
jgi:farnesyl-diphosphate farnesyltransferase